MDRCCADPTLRIAGFCIGKIVKILVRKLPEIRIDKLFEIGGDVDRFPNVLTGMNFPIIGEVLKILLSRRWLQIGETGCYEEK